MITEVQPEPLTDQEYAELGKRLANAIGDLRDMKASAADAVKNLKEGIEDQEREVARLAQMIRTGQRELFEPPQQKIAATANGSAH